MLVPMCAAPVQLVEELFGVTIERTENQHTWHPDVQFYSLKKEGKQKAYFYLDPYSRPAGMNRSTVVDVQKTDTVLRRYCLSILCSRKESLAFCVACSTFLCMLLPLKPKLLERMNVSM